MRLLSVIVIVIMSVMGTCAPAQDAAGAKPADNSLTAIGTYSPKDRPTFSTPDDWADVVMMFEKPGRTNP